MNRIDLLQEAIELVETIEKAHRRLVDGHKSLLFYKKTWFADMAIYYDKKTKHLAKAIMRLESRYQNHLKKLEK